MKINRSILLNYELDPIPPLGIPKEKERAKVRIKEKAKEKDIQILVILPGVVLRPNFGKGE